MNFTVLRLFSQPVFWMGFDIIWHMRSVVRSSSSTWVVSGAQKLCRCVCVKSNFILFRLIHLVTYASLMANPGLY